jgi:restriction endonuclease S subunit
MSAKIFRVDSSEIEGRLDPYYYLPEFRELEEKVKKSGAVPLRKFILSISSGATPKTSESEKYYSDENSGVPFLRVQNITEFGLDLKDVKYINFTTHNTLLNRTKVKENDLLITITGRIASSTVAPKNFNGNINQHSVVIKTDSYKTSKLISTYLNSKVGQKLAYRRSTGGTRPALDYSALLSMPIVFDNRIVQIMDNAYQLKKDYESEAKELLDSIDPYLINKLEIKLPIEKKERVFEVGFSDVVGGRLDPFYHKTYFQELEDNLQKGKYKIQKLGDLCNQVTDGTHHTPRYIDKGIRFISVKNIKDFAISFKDSKYITEEEHLKLLKRANPQKGDILFTKIGTVGNSALILEDTNFSVFVSLALLKPKHEVTYNTYLMFVLSSRLIKQQINRVVKGIGVPDFHLEDIKSLQIPLPPLSIQNEIAESYSISS